MKYSIDAISALGLLGGTTLGSGVAFLMQWQAYAAMTSVAVCGLLGVVVPLLVLGVRAARHRHQSRADS